MKKILLTLVALTGYLLSNAQNVGINTTTPQASLDVKGNARITFTCNFGTVVPEAPKVTLRQTAWLHYTPPERLRLAEALALIGSVRNFLSLAIGQSETIESVKGYRDDVARERPDGSRVRLPIELYWRIPHNPDAPQRRSTPFDVLFTLPQAKPDIGAVLRAWFERQEIFEPVLNLYFGMLHHPNMYLEVRFLSLAQAVETYDFRRRDPYELPEKEHEERLKEVLDSTPDEHRDWLRMRLLSSNYRTLDARIRSVLAECPEVAARIVGRSEEEQGAWVTLFKHTRNYHTHYTPALERKAAKGARLHLLVVQLNAIVEMSLLRELGFGEHEIIEILDRVQRFARIQHFSAQASDED